jgi:RNA polymerase sigma-70 factor, ECF subfamily
LPCRSGEPTNSAPAAVPPSVCISVSTQIAQSLPVGSSAGSAEEQLQRARRGDLNAFRELLRANKARVYSVALRLTGRRADADEIAQDVFLKLHGALAQIGSAAHLKHWLLRTVSHRCIDLQRQQSSRPRLISIDLLPEDAEGLVPETSTDPLLHARLRRLALQLAPEARAVLLLRFQEDLDPSDIATVLAMSVNTVKSHLRRSLEWLRAQLTGDHHES